MNRTLLEECFEVNGRQTWYLEPEEIQCDLDIFIEYYNLKRSHQGYRLKGRTPDQALKEALAINDLLPTNQDLTLQEETTVPDAA